MSTIREEKPIWHIIVLNIIPVVFNIVYFMLNRINSEYIFETSLSVAYIFNVIVSPIYFCVANIWYTEKNMCHLLISFLTMLSSLFWSITIFLFSLGNSAWKTSDKDSMLYSSEMDAVFFRYFFFYLSCQVIF